MENKIFQVIRAEIHPAVVDSVVAPEKYWRHLERTVGVKVIRDSIYDKTEVEGTWSQLERTQKILSSLVNSQDVHQRETLVDRFFETDEESVVSSSKPPESTRSSPGAASVVSTAFTMNTEDLLNYRVTPTPDEEHRPHEAEEDKRRVVRHHVPNRHRRYRDDEDMDDIEDEGLSERDFEHEKSAFWKEPAVLSSEDSTALNSKNASLEAVSMQVDTDIFDYLKKYEKEKIDRIELSNCVQIDWEDYEDVTNIEIRPDRSMTRSSYLTNTARAKDELISMYQTAYLSLTVELVDTGGVPINNDIVKRLMKSKVLCLIPVIAKASSSNELSIIGLARDVQQASKLFLQKLENFEDTSGNEFEKEVSQHRDQSRKKDKNIRQGQGHHDLQVNMDHKRRGREHASTGLHTYEDYPDDESTHLEDYGSTHGFKSPDDWDVKSHLKEFHTKEGLSVQLILGDIARERTDVIVNAANSDLHHLSGIARSILKAAGSKLDKLCRQHVQKYGQIPPTKVMHTAATGQLKCRNVIHAVGPIWDEANPEKTERDLLKTFLNALMYAEGKLQAQSISLPAISSGIFGVPLDVCGRALFTALTKFSKRRGSERLIDTVHIVMCNREGVDFLNAVLEGLFDIAGTTVALDDLSLAEKSLPRKQQTEREALEGDLAQTNTNDIAWYLDFLHGSQTQVKTPFPSSTTKLQKSADSSRTAQSVVSDVLSGRHTEHIQKEHRVEPLIRTRGDDLADQAPNTWSISDSKETQRAHLPPSVSREKYSDGVSHLSHQERDHHSEQRVPSNGGNCKSLPPNLDRYYSNHSVAAGSEKNRDDHLSSLAGRRVLSEQLSAPVNKEALRDRQLAPADFSSHRNQQSVTASRNGQRNNQLNNNDYVLLAPASRENDSNRRSATAIGDSLRNPPSAPGRPNSQYYTMITPAMRDNMRNQLLLSTAGQQDRQRDSHSLPANPDNRDQKFTDLGHHSQSSRAESQTHETVEEKKASTSPSKEETCSICLDILTNPTTLPDCQHTFCKNCLDEYFDKCKPACPTCGKIYGDVRGDQPAGGSMTSEIRRDIRLPGYEDYGTIIITYTFPNGIQGPNHPSPGEPYRGDMRLAYLPASPEGRSVLKLLKVAFDKGLTFTIGESRTSGRKGVITWNDIHHKTSIHGGPTRFGYPDSDYLSRVKEELNARGIK